MDKMEKYRDKEKINKIASKYGFWDGFFGTNDVLKFSKKIIKMEHYNVQIRAELLLERYLKVFTSDRIKKEATMLAYELQYKNFMNGDERDETRFSEIYSDYVDDQNYLYFVDLTTKLDKLEKQGLDLNKLSSTNKQFMQMTKQVKNECGLSESFDYPKFYSDWNTRKDISRKIQFYIIDVEKLKEKKYEEEKMLTII